MAFEGAADRSMDWPAPGEADWDAIYAEHLPRIYNYFRFRLAAEADVEDLTARVFEKAWSARDRYQRDVAAFSTWLYRIAQNVGIDYPAFASRSRTARSGARGGRGPHAGRRRGATLGPRAACSTHGIAVGSRARPDRTQVWRRPEQPGDRSARGVERIERRDDPAPYGANVAVAMVAAESTDER